MTGGRGADTLHAGQGRDHIYADRDDRRVDTGFDWDSDRVVGQTGAPPPWIGPGDSVHTYHPEAIDAWLDGHPQLDIKGHSEFTEHAKAELGVLLGTAEGSRRLHQLVQGLEHMGLTLELVDGPAPGESPFLPELPKYFEMPVYHDGLVKPSQDQDLNRPVHHDGLPRPSSTQEISLHGLLEIIKSMMHNGPFMDQDMRGGLASTPQTPSSDILSAVLAQSE